MSYYIVKQKQCELCGATMKNVGCTRKYCDTCLKALRSKQADEHNKKMAAYYAAKKKSSPASGQQYQRCMCQSTCCRPHLRPAGGI